MAMNLAPFLRQRYFDSNGDPLAGGKLYSYQAGTSTPQSTYTNSGGGTANANPVVLDADGEAAVWLDPTLSYKFVLHNSSDVEQWTEDNVVGQLTADSVATASIQALAVTTAKIANDAVTAAKLADSASVDADRAVTTDHIRDAAITRAKLATGAVAKQTVSDKTTTYTATESDDVITCNATGGAFTVTLPAAAALSGKVLRIKKTDSSINIVTVDGNASETIDGALTIKLATQYESALIVCNGTGWEVLNRRIPSKWITWTPTGSWSTNTTYTGRYRRVGPNMEMEVGISLAGAPTAAALTVNLPTSPAYVIDTAEIVFTAANTEWVGSGVYGLDASSDSYALSVQYNSTTSVRLKSHVSNATYATNGLVDASNPFAGGSGDTLQFKCSVPIVGWEG